jgi:hypothetical protein
MVFLISIFNFYIGFAFLLGISYYEISLFEAVTVINSAPLFTWIIGSLFAGISF